MLRNRTIAEMVENDTEMPEIDDPELEGLDTNEERNMFSLPDRPSRPLNLDPENEAALDPETRAIRANYKLQPKTLHIPMTDHMGRKPMTQLKFSQGDLERYARATVKWASSRPAYKRKSAKRTYKRAYKPRKRTYKRKWVPYKTWLKRQKK